MALSGSALTLEKSNRFSTSSSISPTTALHAQRTPVQLTIQVWNLALMHKARIFNSLFQVTMYKNYKRNHSITLCLYICQNLFRVQWNIIMQVCKVHLLLLWFLPCTKKEVFSIGLLWAFVLEHLRVLDSKMESSSFFTTRCLFIILFLMLNAAIL